MNSGGGGIKMSGGGGGAIEGGGGTIIPSSSRSGRDMTDPLYRPSTMEKKEGDI